MEAIFNNLHKQSENKLIWILVLLLTCEAQTDSDSFTIPNTVKLRFVSGSTMGLYLAVVIPVDLPPTNAYVGFFYEAIHSLPTNETSYEYPPLVERGMNRKWIYNMIENNIISRGFPGKPCLLRAICEVSLHSVHAFNGILGDIIHIILTPSSSKNLELSSEYEKAELKGKAHDCIPYNSNCSISIVDLISTFVHF